MGEAQSVIGYRDFIEWMAFLDFEPHGEERADLRAGIIASTIANANSKRRFTPLDFMPIVSRIVKEQRAASTMSPEQIMAAINTANKARARR